LLAFSYAGKIISRLSLPFASAMSLFDGTALRRGGSFFGDFETTWAVSLEEKPKTFLKEGSFETADELYGKEAKQLKPTYWLLQL
jgi:hypothetical protein